jgi:hypothetical protein
VAASPKETGGTCPVKVKTGPVCSCVRLNSKIFNPFLEGQVGSLLEMDMFYVPFIFRLTLKIRFREKITEKLLEILYSCQKTSISSREA